jgi:hypothetical protein
VLFAKALKGREAGAGTVEGLDQVDPEALLEAADGERRGDNSQLSKLLTEDITGERALVRHNCQDHLASSAHAKFQAERAY